MLNVLLVEDDLDLAETVVEFLQLDKIACDHCANGRAALDLIERNQYDVLMLDLNLPRLDGLAVCQRVRADGIDTPILMLTARDRLEDKVEGFNAGTDDYLVKPFELQELEVRLQALARRRSGQVRRLSFGELVMDLNQRKVFRKKLPLKISPTGWKLLESLLRAAPDPVSRQHLEKQVWGDELPDSNALKVHMHHLRKAVDAQSESPMIVTIPNVGFALSADYDGAGED